MNAPFPALSNFAPIRPETLVRPASRLMTPEALASIQPSRISASRALIARAVAGRWRIACEHFTIDERGRGETIQDPNLRGSAASV